MDDTNDFGIALDVDGVLAGFAPAFVRKAKELGIEGFYDHFAEWNTWYSTGEAGRAFQKVWPHIEYDWEFWVDEIQPLETAYVPYEVTAYVSSRGKAPEGATEEWLDMHDFPKAPVYIVDDSKDKLSVLRRIKDATKLDVFVDDKPPTVRQVYEAHRYDPESVPLPLLMTSPANSHFSDGDVQDLPRVTYLPEVPRATKEYTLDTERHPTSAPQQ